MAPRGKEKALKRALEIMEAGVGIVLINKILINIEILNFIPRLPPILPPPIEKGLEKAAERRGST